MNNVLLENGRTRRSMRRTTELKNDWQRLFGQAGNRALIVYWLYGLAITAAEIIVAYGSVKTGIILHILLLGALLAHSAWVFHRGVPWLFLALTLAPLTRILSLSMPLGGIPPVYWYVAISAPLFAAAAGVMRVAGFAPGEVGFTLRNLPVQFLIALIGLPLGFIEFIILKPRPMVTSLAPAEIWFPALVFIVCTGLLEEFVFRGVMYRAALKAVGDKFALVYVSCIFAVLHITHLSLWDVVFVFAVALLFTKIFAWQKSIVGVSLAHGLTNITLYLICPLIF